MKKSLKDSLHIVRVEEDLSNFLEFTYSINHSLRYLIVSGGFKQIIGNKCS
jgi:hypothetical protein